MMVAWALRAKEHRDGGRGDALDRHVLENIFDRLALHQTLPCISPRHQQPLSTTKERNTAQHPHGCTQVVHAGSGGGGSVAKGGGILPLKGASKTTTHHSVGSEIAS